MTYMKGKKKIVIVAGCGIVLVAIVLAVFLGKRKKTVTDVVRRQNEVVFNVDRQFFLYDKDPFDKNNGKVEPIREIKVTFEGTGNSETNEYDGNVIVEGFELGGNFQGYYFSEQEDEYSLTCTGLNMKDRETVEGERYEYSISISQDFKDIKIWIYEVDESDGGEYHWVLNNNY